MTILLHGKTFSKEVEVHLISFIDQLLALNINIIYTKPFYEILKKCISIHNNKMIKAISSLDDTNEEINYLICFGGDGTILNAATIAKNSGIPIVGINTGRLGFLATIAKNEVSKLMEKLIEKKYTLSNRTVLSVSTTTNVIKLPFALNEISVLSKENTSMMNIKVFLNNEYLNTYWADGLIISTPTGSTGYSLSCGGPIVMPESNNFIITPIAPHNLNVRPLIISDSNIIRIEIADNPNEEFLLSMDSRNYSVLNKTPLIIKKANYNIKLLQLNSTTYSKTLREKLLWGLDKRNYDF